MKLKVLSLLIAIISCFNSQGQSADSLVAKSDSVEQAKRAQYISDSIANQLEEYSNLVRRSEQKRIDDSVKKAELLQQINLLKENDKLKQADLLRQVRNIEIQDSTRKAEQLKKINQLKETAVGYPVTPFGDTLFMVFTKLGPVMPKERAANITKKIEVLYHDDNFKPDSLQVILNESTADITFGEMILMSVTDTDALWVGREKKALATEHATAISKGIEAERDANSWKNILMRVALTLLIIAGTYGLIYLLNRLFRKLNLLIIVKKDSLFHGIRFRDYEILPPKRELDLTLRISTILKWAVFGLLMYISLPLLFSVFPFTRGWAATLFGWVWEPTKSILISIFSYLPNVFSIVIIYLATHYAIKFIKFVAQEIAAERLKFTGFYADWAMPTFNIIKVLLYAFMFVVIFPYLPGSDSKIFQGVSVFLGILFSLGSSTAIANAVAGLVITYMRPFKVGDRVKIDDIVGDVVEKSLLVTRLRTPKNEDITVPNASILGGKTINYSTSSKELGLILHTTVTIGYDVPWKQVHELLIAAALATDGVNNDHKPFVLQTSLDDYYVSYQLNAYTAEPNKMPRTYSDLHQNIQDKFNESGVEILSPHYRALRDGNMVTTPVNYLPKDYQAPAFNVNSKQSSPEPKK
ncbi:MULTISPECIES: mechanosensitive ion channel family protein [unclassified Imperialibacter]|uniref:mechanosensitive ion channel family protein n=1 Tax=unclassified Imperialibacter TaxID=2629706 RepID=UPI00125B0BD6|nr:MULTISPECIES: mechanosensitive ion channel family protein [unclassified Imperialibacter]CAD5253756.1 Mechanosensitive ion channel [Imperialibacter sp. 75]CAD5262113.1 Mechanosensitive ion channel [Imperialibacter sp. 89]VVT35187.1 Mechanosensitive ion channel [Imperialibacter sp. EC-SDR9]